jgi:cell division protein FtsQ
MLFLPSVFTRKVRNAQIDELLPVLLSAIPTKPDIVRRIAEVFGSSTVFMARKTTSTLPEEDFESAAESRASARSFDDSPLDARMLDLDDEGESPFLRGQKRVPVRRGALPRKAVGRIKFLMIVLLVAGVAGLVGITLYRYGTQSWRFRIDSSDDIALLGNQNVTRSQVLDVMGGDIDRNVFYVPLAERKKQLEDIPWVESAAVMRLYPNQVRIELRERTPVAFVAVASHIALIDSHGVIMDLPAGAQTRYSFPVIVGMSENEPLSTRAPRMKMYAELMKELDSTGAHYSQSLSEVDLSDPDDVKATVSDPKGAVLVHLGSSSFLERFQMYMAHVQEWRSQFSHLDSIDLRYAGQVIVNPETSAGRPKIHHPELRRRLVQFGRTRSHHRRKQRNTDKKWQVKTKTCLRSLTLEVPRPASSSPKSTSMLSAIAATESPTQGVCERA